jgi:hypothetical protein
MPTSNDDSRAERRRHPRYEIDLPVTLVLATQPPTALSGTMRDLSAGGCCFLAEPPPENFDTVSLSFRRGLRAPAVTGHVVRREGREAFAVRFSHQDVELGRLVSALGAIAPGLRADFVNGFLDPAVEVSP